MGKLLKPLDYCHERIVDILNPGDYALDATCGNGWDTLLLARGVGSQGRVYAFDLQEAATDATAALLYEHGVRDRVTIFNESHERITSLVDSPLKVAMFNLRYLPGGNRQIITRPETTLKALQDLFSLLLPGGLISLMAYRGHPGGEMEYTALRKFLSGLEQKDFRVLHYAFINQANYPPELFFVEKIS